MQKSNFFKSNHTYTFTHTRSQKRTIAVVKNFDASKTEMILFSCGASGCENMNQVLQCHPTNFKLKHLPCI